MTARVSASEAALLEVAKALFTPKRAPAVRRWLARAVPLPERISPQAMEVLRNTLARGTVLDLMRAGGWRGGHGARLWDRHPPPSIYFSAQAWNLLATLIRAPSVDLEPWVEPSCAERWLLTRVLAVLHASGQSCAAPVFRAEPLCWLIHPDALAGSGPPGALDFAPWFTPEGQLWLEGAQGRLAERWCAMEQAKPKIIALARMSALGAAQSAVLAAFFDAADAAGRRDLCGFAVEAAARVLAPGPTAEWWIERLSADATLGERHGARHGAGAFLEALGTLAGWHRQHGETRFFDEEYDAAQALLSAWEGFGPRGFEVAAALVTDLQGWGGL